MKRALPLFLTLVMLLCLLPTMAFAAEEAVLSPTWSQGTYYDNAINPNLVSRKYTVIDCKEGDVVTFDYPSANWAIYVYYADAQGSMGYVTSKQGSNETFVVEAKDGRVPTHLQLTAFHRSGSNVTITDELWKTFDVTISRTSQEPVDNTFTFVTQNVGLWNDGVHQGVAADKVEERAAAWQAVMENHGMDILVGQEWLPYLDADKTVDANEKVFAGEYPYIYGEHTSTYDGKNIISRTPLTDISYTAQVSNVGRRYAKAYTWIDGKKVCIIDAHLSFEEDINVNRKEEMVELLNLAQGETYVIIAGDFNVFTAEEFEIFEEAGYSLANAGAFGQFNTWPNLGRNPTAEVNRVIDNIIVSPGIKIHSAWAEDHQLSDHALLAAELELLEAEEITDNRLLCEHCNQFVQWQPLTMTNGGTANAILESGHYYFPTDLTKLTGAFFVGNKTSAFPEVVIDLRGHAFSSTSRAFYVRANSKLSLVDTVGCGTFSTSYTSTGGVVYVEGGATFNLYDGTLYSNGTPTTDRKGGNIYAETSALVNIYGGEVYGGYASHGCALYGANKNTITISGGTLYGNTATSVGGVVYVNGGTLNMTSGTITGGKGGSGGGVYLYTATGNLTGGKIYGNTGTYGGNVHTSGNQTTGGLNLGNCEIYGGTASVAGDDIYISSTGAATLITKEATITEAENKNVTTTAGDMVLYVDGVYTVHDHNMVTDEAVAPGCESTGLTEGRHCTGCDTQTVAQEEVGATGHSEQVVAGKAATCTEPGLTDGKLCTACGKTLLAQEEISALGHAYESVYTAPTVEADGFTTYTCGNCGDSYAVIEEGTRLTIAIITQPGAASAAAGETAVFTVEAAGEGLHCRWQYQRAGGTKWFNTTMEGYNTSRLQVAATVARNGYRYRCVVTNSNGDQLISEAATLTVSEKTIASSGPADQVAVNGQAVFTVSVEGEGLTYRWQYRRAGGTKWFDTTMEGYKTNALTVIATEARNGYQYRCIITDAYGNETVSDAAVLTVG